MRVAPPVRKPIVIGPKTAALRPAYSGDLGGTFHAVDSTTGKLIRDSKKDEHAGARITAARTSTALSPAAALARTVSAGPAAA